MNTIIGTWKLQSFIMKMENGNTFLPFGEEPEGMIIYTDNGYMSVSLARKGRTNFAENNVLGGTEEEKLMAYSSFSHYSGKYTILTENTLTHEIIHSLFPNWKGVSEKRTFEINDNTLTLITPEFLVNNNKTKGYVIFERI